MKSLLHLTLLFITFGTASAQIPEGQPLWAFPANSLVGPNGLQTLSFLPDHVKVEREPQTDPNNYLLSPLKISYDGTTELQLKLLSHDWSRFGPSSPNEVVTHHFAIVGEVRYENVSAGSYLEMWSHFASPAPGYPEAAYFSRTLEENGPMGKLEGTHDWREFGLPFDSTSTKTKLVGLEMNLHLTGPGTVYFRNMRLVQYPDAEINTAATSPKELGVLELVVQLRSKSDGGITYSVDGITKPDVDAVQQVLAAVQKADVGSNTHPQVNVIVRADKNVPYNDVARVLDAIKEAGIQTVAFATSSATTSQNQTVSGHTPNIDASEWRGIDWKSFFLGVAATGVSLLAGGGIIFISRRWNRRRHERELRRIASLDS